MNMAGRISTLALALTLPAMAACGDDDVNGPGAVTFNVTLTKAAEAPVCEAAGANATGTATITVNSGNNSIQVSNLTFTGLSGPATMAHVHFGPVGTIGPPVLDFGANPTSPASKTFSTVDYPSPIPSGAPMSFQNFALAVRGGVTYINVHTAACPAGEIRAQIATPPAAG